MSESTSMASRIAAVMDRVPNRGNVHVFLGHPLSDGCDKTTAEPGNTYSPGVWTCGVSLWFESADKLVTPDLLADDAIEWTLEPPVLRSRYRAGSVAVEHELCHLGGEGAEGADFSQVMLRGAAGATLALCIVVRDIGPAGGKIATIEPLPNGLLIDGSLRLTCESRPEEVRVISPGDGRDTPVGFLRVSVTLAESGTGELRFKTEHGFARRTFASAIPQERPWEQIRVADAMQRSREQWRGDLPARVFAPDPRIARAWEQCAHHIQAAMECGLPRIGAVDYPVLWHRDGVLVLRALDLMGRSDLARLGNAQLAPHCFGGGFGAEADAPGQGIWSLLTHGRFTNDAGWLADVFPHVKKRAEWIIRMRHADKPLRAVTENRMPQYMHSPGINLVCLPAQHGTIHGRMDWQQPDFFINCWAITGLRLAADAARSLGHDDLAADWQREAEELDRALREHLLPRYGSNDRDPIITPHPSGAFGAEDETVRESFQRWYRANRLTADRKRKAEPLWTYFEAAQIHNAMLLGLRDEAWTNLDGMLDDGPWPVSAFVEGNPGSNESLPFRTGNERRGWLRPGSALAGNMPHNWTSAEMICLIRDMFVVEDGKRLLLGKGVRREWLRPGMSFGCSGMKTSMGTVSYEVVVDASCRPKLRYSGPAEYALAVS